MAETQKPPLFWDGDVDEFARKIALITRELLEGKSNNGLDVTLRPSETTTTIERPRVSVETKVSLMPKSASAASALSSGSLWIEVSYGRITIHHDATADADRTFGAVLVG